MQFGNHCLVFAQVIEENNIVNQRGSLKVCLQSWILIARGNKERAAYYYTLALLYAVPTICAFSISIPLFYVIFLETLVVGVIHVQVGASLSSLSLPHAVSVTSCDS